MEHKDLRRFRSKIVAPDVDGCHTWCGTIDANGYGRFKLRGKYVSAHRLAFALEHGRLPEPCCLHRCDNPRCVNPAHLFEGTQPENIADMVAKGRARAPRGELHGMAKLTNSQVAELRQTYADGGVTQRALAARYGISRDRVNQIVSGRPHSRNIRKRACPRRTDTASRAPGSPSAVASARCG